jgi:DNA-binding GntR family transcriptional regulator
MGIESAFTPVRAGLLATEVREQIRDRILDGTLKPGDSIKDSVLAESMRISRSPVREALRMLEQSGLLVKTPNRSYQVISFSELDVDELVELRIAYESMAVRWLVQHHTPVESLELHLRDMLTVPGSAEPNADFVGADGRFHIGIVRLTALPRLISSYEAIRDQIDLMLRSGFLTQLQFMATQYDRHRELYDELAKSVESGDATAMLELLQFHISAGMKFQENSIEAAPAAQ